VWRSIPILAAVACAGCAPWVRVRRALAPESFVTPVSAHGELAAVLLDDGWVEDDDALPYSAIAAVADGWVEPVPVTDRGYIEVVPLRSDVTIRVYTRHTGLEPRDFEPVVARSGTLRGELPTTLRFLPSDPLGEPFRLYMEDLHNVYNEEPLGDGDLLMIEVRAPDRSPERYLFRSLEFGLRSRFVAGVLVRVPVPWVVEPPDVGPSPALTASLAFAYRARSRKSGLSFASEQLALIVSVGVGSSVLESEGLDEQILGVYNASLAGGGIELFKFASAQFLGNATAPFRRDVDADWTVAFGIDAVQLGRFAEGLGARVAKEHPLREDR
jgi:hypothetical protein